MAMSAYLKSFLTRQGHWMMLANVVTKLFGFAAVVYVTRNTTEVDYGSFSFAKNAIGAAVPFMGIGAYQAFMRYAADAPGQLAKKELYAYAYARGMLFSLALVAVLWLIAPWVCLPIPESVETFRILIWLVIGTFVMESVKSYARAIHCNQISARIDVVFAISLLVATVALTSGMGVQGYALSIAISPLLAAVPFGIRMGLFALNWKSLSPQFEGFWSYGLYTTAGAVLGQMFYALDIFLIGHFVGEKANAVALYRVAFIIPMATMVLPSSVAATDYMSNALNKHKGKVLRDYMRNYWRTFGILSFISLGLLALLAPQILQIFGGGYSEGALLMRLMLFGMLGAHLFRVPYGQLLSAVGKANWNTWISVVLVALTAASCIWCIPKWGGVGAAGAMATMYWVGGIMNALMFEVYLRSETK